MRLLLNRFFSMTPRKFVQDFSYEAAVFQLNSLQSNAATLNKIRERRQIHPDTNIKDTEEILRQLDIRHEQIDKMNIIHVSGTKGKGSTCAFTESILRHLGFKTGFYSSPHLVHVRERIRINGKPISEKEFAANFYEVFGKLQQQIPDLEKFPAYFKFLTLMAFHIFIKERVDVAVIEVGIGGEYDCTNVLRNPVVCGISTLDFDHISILGSTLKEIAWHKAGIMKPNSVAVGVEQPEEAMKVIRERSQEKKCTFHLTPPFENYILPNQKLESNLGLSGHHQSSNITLALQLVNIWLQRTQNIESFPDLKKILPKLTPEKELLEAFEVPAIFLEGLKNCFWPGRGQILLKNEISYFLDGAHTPKSIAHCVDWFKNEQKTRLEKGDSERPLQVLMFHCTADRNPTTLLPYLKECQFDIALFCPTRVLPILDKHLDTTNLNQSETEQKERCLENKELWVKITGNSDVKTFDCIQDTVEYLPVLAKERQRRLHVLVTGSLHLVGGVLSLIDPDVAS